ncbi:MAG: hypothetical protein RR320_02910 [Oscillospiraceae bacterium]
MFQKKLFDSHIEPACAYCALGEPTQDGEAILCERRGIVLPSYHCRKYVYDPLRRTPKLPPELARFDRSDFTL